MADFTHFDERGNAIMVDVGGKPETSRFAAARGEITMSAETLAMIREGRAKKGDVLGVARLAGIMAAKKTADLIPLCHPIAFTKCAVEFFVNGEAIEAECAVSLCGKTGAEMEALTGVSVALLTIYDMCKAAERGMVIGNIRLVEKAGGKSGHYRAG